MTTTFVTADLHLYHYNIALHCDREPWIYDNPDYDPSKQFHIRYNNPKAVDLERHDNDIIDNWNSMVGKKDVVWILGDVAWKKHAHFLMRLKGKKHLIRGNHDKMTQDAFSLFQKIDGAHYRYSYYTMIHKRRVMLSHCPYDTWFSSGHGSWSLHGHCHGRHKEYPDKLQFDVGIDVWGYKPVPWDVIEAKMLHKEDIRKEVFKERQKGRDISDADVYLGENRQANMMFSR